MHPMLTAFYSRPLALYLAAALIALSSFAGPAEAMFLPAAPEIPAGPGFHRAADLAVIQKALESRALQQRLMDYGLSSEEALSKLDGLSDEQLHRLAVNIDALQPGGDAVGTLAAVLLIALLVVLLIYLLEGRIEIRRR